MRKQGRFSLMLFSTFIIFILSFVAKAEVKGDYVAGEYLVKLKNNSLMASSQSMQPMGMMFNGRIKSIVSKKSQMMLVERSILERTESVLEELQQNPEVDIVEPNYIYHASRTPNDSQMSELWGLINKEKGSGGVDIDAALAWDITQGSRNVVVAVIDSGVNYKDSDLKNNMWINQAEKNGKPGVDDDGNGYIDDIYGYDFANNDSDPMDDNDHGSHCSGTIGAEGNNGTGVVGVNWRVKIMALKFLSSSGGGTLESAIRAIDYATDKNVQVMSNSWGGGGKSQLLEDAIRRAEKKGILFVAAAGNERNNNDSNPSYPASYQVPNVISVAAIDSTGKIASFSNYGKKGVHVAAPGVDILSTGKNGLKKMSGTSMAAPHVSGIAALLLAKNPTMKYGSLKKRILETSVPRIELRGKIRYGVVNAYKALINEQPLIDPNDPAHWPTMSENTSTSHPYANNFEQTYNFKVEGAQRVSLYFNQLETESGYDKVFFYDGEGTEIGVISGNHSDSFSPIAEGDTIVVKFVSDGSVDGFGFDVTQIAYDKGYATDTWRSEADTLSTSHPYQHNIDEEVVFEKSGASEIRVKFGQFITEKKYDFVYFYDQEGKELARWDGDHSGEYSPIARGSKIILRIKSDFSIADYGFDVEAVDFR